MKKSHPPGNLLLPPPGTPGVETCATLLGNPAFTLEHIVSRSAASPAGFWYDQERAEWVLLLRGEASIQFKSGKTVRLAAGEPLVIPARCRHRVEHTSPDAVWLALHYQEKSGDCNAAQPAGTRHE
jgi:cupin 2 domain-containing protein